MMNYEFSRAMVAERRQAARRAGEQARIISEVRAARRDKRADGPRPRTVIARGMRPAPGSRRVTSTAGPSTRVRGTSGRMSGRCVGPRYG